MYGVIYGERNDGSCPCQIGSELETQKMKPKKAHRMCRHLSVAHLKSLSNGFLITSPKTWNLKMEVWKMMFLFKQGIFRFHVSFRGCNSSLY